jgi:hypothetical protein
VSRQRYSQQRETEGEPDGEPKERLKEKLKREIKEERTGTANMSKPHERFRRAVVVVKDVAGDAYERLVVPVLAETLSRALRANTGLPG